MKDEMLLMFRFENAFVRIEFAVGREVTFLSSRHNAKRETKIAI